MLPKNTPKTLNLRQMIEEQNNNKVQDAAQSLQTVVSKSLPSNDLASWTIRNGWTYNFCDDKWWQLQESQNYLKKTTKEIADIILSESNVC